MYYLWLGNFFIILFDVCDGWVSVLGSLRNRVLIKRIVDISMFSGKFNCQSTLFLSGLCIIIAACLVPSINAVSLPR